MLSTTANSAVVPRPTPKAVSSNVSASKSQPAAPSPGRFQHPRMAEIAKRRATTSFSAQNVQTILLNAALITASFLSSDIVHPILTKIVQTISLEQLRIPVDASSILTLLRLLFLANIFLALRPVLPYFRETDKLEDIDLTPAQRSLLGLLPTQSNTPKTPVYVTPPRYMRSSPFTSTPQTNQSTDRRSISVNYTPQSTPKYSPGASQQPASATPSQRISGSPFSASPLYNKAITNSTSQNNLYSQADFTESTRSLLAGRESTSFYPGNSLRRSQNVRDPGTPSPGARERTKVKLEPGLNYKWLYEKGLKVGKNGGIEY